MSKLHFKLPLIFIVVALVSTVMVSAQRPQYVYTFDGFDYMTDAQVEAIDNYLHEVDVAEGVEIVFVIEYEMPYPTMRDMAVDYFDNVPLSGKTGIGKAETDLGILVIVAFQEGEFYLMTGQQSMSYVTASEAGRILDNLISYTDDMQDYTGFKKCAEEIAGEFGYDGKVTDPVVVKPKPEPKPEPVVYEPIDWTPFYPVFVFLVIFIILGIPVTSEREDKKWIWERRF